MKWFCTIVVLVGLTLRAQDLTDPVWVASLNAAAQGSAPDYLLSEDCEGTGTPSGWTDSGSPNWDYATSPAPLAGSQSLYLDGVSTRSTYKSFTSSSEVYVYFVMNVPAFTAATDLVRLRDSGGTAQLAFRVHTSSSFRLQVGSVSQIYSSSFAAGTTYHIWLHYKKGTGSDAIGECWINTSSTKPGSANSPTITTGTSTANVEQFFTITASSTCSLVADTIRVSASSIGSSPP